MLQWGDSDTDDPTIAARLPYDPGRVSSTLETRLAVREVDQVVEAAADRHVFGIPLPVATQAPWCSRGV